MYSDIFGILLEYAARKGLSTWPKGARWPALLQSSEAGEEKFVKQVASSSTSPAGILQGTANRTLAEAQETEATDQAHKIDRRSEAALPGEGHDSQESPSSNVRKMSSCTIWMGSSSGEQGGQSALLENIETRDLMQRDGIAIVYNPLIPNDAVPGFDPMAVSTWSFSLERDETEKVLKVAEVWTKNQRLLGMLLLSA